jgi:type IV pilus assembly protein PilA
MEETKQHEVAAPAAPVAEIRKPSSRKEGGKKIVKKRKSAGFSLLELLIVVAIIAILAAIALPKFLQARTTAVENSGAAASRSMVTAVQAYNSKWNVMPPTLAALGGSSTSCATGPSATAACLLDDTIASTGAAGQYTFTYSTTGGDFTLNADPASTSAAKRHYYSDSNLSLRYADGAAATATSPILGN